MTNIKNRVIILDSNIVWYAYSDKYTQQVFTEYITRLVNDGCIIALSYVSVSEVIARARKSQEKAVYEIIKSSYKLFDIDEKVLMTVAYYTRLYAQMNISKQQIDLADKIISATAFLTNSLILTADLDDYPRSLFIEIERKQIEFKKRSSNESICVCILQSDIRTTTKYFDALK